jgi:multidrug efflux pump subunit AcrB
MGKFIAVMPRAVIVILIISLGEALIILPAHLSCALTRAAVKRDSRPSWHERIRLKVERLLNVVIEKYYTTALKYVVKNRYFTFAIGVGVLIISLGIVVGGYVPFVFFPKGESDWVIAEVGYPLGTPYQVTEQTIEHLEKQAFKLNGLFNKKLKHNGDLIVNTFALVGMIPRRDWKPGESGGHCGEVWIELVPSEKRRNLSVNTVLNKWRSLTGEIPGLETLTFTTLEGGPGGNPIEIQLVGKDLNQLRRAADELKIEMRTYPGTFDITDNFKPGKEEKQVNIKEGARSLGITMTDIARQLRQAFYGDEALRIQRGRDDLQEIPIEEVADITHGRAYSVIHRVDRKRVITVISNLDESIANASKIVADLNKNFLPKLIERYPEIEYDLEGQEKRTRESLDSLKKGFILAIIIQPVIIMMAIPFGLIGAIAGHLVMGLAITMISIFGIVALSGIVVNDSLILIDFINRAARNNMEIETAVVESGKVRFRPVLLTSITTIAGLLPLLLERSFQAQFLIPMAVSIRRF